MSRVYTYKRTVNEIYWQNQLKKIGKKLTYKDRKLLRATKCEKDNNESLMRIQAKALSDGLHIPCLTGLVGDCMFESIEKTGLCNDKKIFRQSVARLFFLFSDSNVISSYNITLKETFDLFNEIEYVYCHNTNRLYKYTYYTMCSDMYKDGSWSRLPTEIILTVISIFFKVRIHVYHDNGHVNKICDVELNKILSNDDPSCNIHIALVGENHYVPLVPKPHDDIIKCPKYSNQLKKFLKWAQEKSDAIGLYIDQDIYHDIDRSDKKLYKPIYFGKVIDSNKSIKSSELFKADVQSIVKRTCPSVNIEDDLQSYDTNIPEDIVTIMDVPSIVVSSYSNNHNKHDKSDININTVGNEKVIIQNDLLFFI